ncbi:MAG: hypothetical protein AABW89_02125 [Nanoarchaeota archaeon]
MRRRSFEGTKTKKGLEIKAKIDKNIYELKKKVSDEDYENISFVRHEVNPQWNYTLSKI